MVLVKRAAFAYLMVIFIFLLGCFKTEENDIVFCSDPDFPYFCPSGGKCCSLPVYGKQANKCYSTVSDCGKVGGQSCESCTIEPNNTTATSGGNFFFANWTCGGSSQCATVMGAASGTAGPFCDVNVCNAWGQKFIPAGYTCSGTPANTPNSGSPPNGMCFQIGDF